LLGFNRAKMETNAEQACFVPVEVFTCANALSLKYCP
jgi:hypothetical protein